MWAVGAGGLGIKFRFSQSRAQPAAQCFNVTLSYIYVKSWSIPTWQYIRNSHSLKPLFIWKANDFKSLFSNTRGMKIRHKGSVHSWLSKTAAGVTSLSRSSLHLPDITLSKWRNKEILQSNISETISPNTPTSLPYFLVLAFKYHTVLPSAYYRCKTNACYPFHPKIRAQKESTSIL